MSDSIKKEIDSLISKRSNFTTILVVVITGTIGLMFNYKLVYLFPITLGILTSMVFFNGILNAEVRIKNLLEELKK